MWIYILLYIFLFKIRLLCIKIKSYDYLLIYRGETNHITGSLMSAPQVPTVSTCFNVMNLNKRLIQQYVILYSHHTHAALYVHKSAFLPALLVSYITDMVLVMVNLKINVIQLKNVINF